LVRLAISQEPEFRERFLNRYAAIGRLNHPNILEVYDIGEADGHLYAVLPLVEGRTLAALLREQRVLQPDHVIEIARQVALALAQTHQAGFVHGDIKPSNVLISSSGRVLLLDFDLAYLAGEPSFTDIGTIRGTPAYMSPERIRGEHIDTGSDVFSLGVVLYECLTGERPFSGATEGERVRNLVQCAPRSPVEINPSVPPGVARIILTALEKDPKLRPSAELLSRILPAALQAPPGLPDLPISGVALGEDDPTQEMLPYELPPFHRSGSLSLLSAPHDDPTREVLAYRPPPFSSASLLQNEPKPIAWLLVLNGPLRGKQFRLAGPLRIGRYSRFNDLVLADDPSVSRTHAQILLNGDQFCISELGSKSGLFVNGVRVDSAPLQDRDEIQIGGTVMLFISAVSAADLNVEAKRRLHEFDTIWDELRDAVRHD
jgi:serine/threonine protein kinase